MQQQNISLVFPSTNVLLGLRDVHAWMVERQKDMAPDYNLMIDRDSKQIPCVCTPDRGSMSCQYLFGEYLGSSDDMGCMRMAMGVTYGFESSQICAVPTARGVMTTYP